MPTLHNADYRTLRLLAAAVKNMLSVMDRHGVDSYECPDSGRHCCDCLEHARKRVEACMPRQQLPMQGCCVDRACTSATCRNLPDGQACGTCRHFERCERLIGARKTDRTCDWFPRRFVDRKGGGA